MIKKEKIKDLHYSLTGVIPVSEIESASNEILTEYGKKAKIPGFRAGHIPMKTLQEKFGANAFADAADKLMNADLNNFINEKKIRLAGAPKADVQKFEVGSDVEFTVEFDILPTLPKIDFEKFTLTKRVAKTPESEIERAIENIRKSRAQNEKQADDYVAQNGDVAVIDFTGYVGDDAFEGGAAKRHHLALGSGSFIPGFEEQIVGHKAGDEFDVNVKFPAEYHSEKLAGADARFAIKLHEVRKPVLPELNDELAVAVGMETVDALREHIRKILTEQYAEASKREMRDELLEILNDKVKLELPESLVDAEFNAAKADNKDTKFDDKRERKEAEKRVKLGLILAEWGNQNKVSVSNEDIQGAIWAEAARYPDQMQVFDFYNKNPNALQMLRGMLFERKSLDAMLELVKTKEKEVSAEELFKQHGPR